ncbi:hypothetical protein SR39_06220 [Methylobacterium radiotolerans]|jgi:hypothetical protein|nr:hypothetical protein SR39_06220 [Methylobacterium radiotolerans]
MPIQAYRQASSGFGDRDGSLYAFMKLGLDRNAMPASINFTVTIAAGKGWSDITVSLQPRDFERVAQAMMNVDPAAALKAFGAAMVAGNQSEPHPVLRE